MVGRVREEKMRRQKVRQEKQYQKKKNARARKCKKCGPGWLKRRVAKAAGAEPSGQMRDEQLHGVVVRSIFPSQTRDTSASVFGS